MNSNSEPNQDEMEWNPITQSQVEAGNPRLLLANWLYWSRQNRPSGDDSRLFGEPAWDMVLDLYIHQLKGRPTSITGACIGSHAPATTALRYIDLLCEMGWVEKIPDDNDRRRSLLALTAKAKEDMNSYLDRLLDRLRQMTPNFLSSPHT